MRIQDFLFKRYKPANKLEFIAQMTESDLASITEKDILKIMSEGGERVSAYNKYKNKSYKTHRGKLTMGSSLRVGNGNNSVVDCFYETPEHKVMIGIHIWGYDVDEDTETSFTNAGYSYTDSDNVWGKFTETYRNGCSQIINAIYYKSDYIAVMRAMLYEYVCTKYNLKHSDYFRGTGRDVRIKSLEAKEEMLKEYTVYRTKTVTEKTIVKAKTEKEALEKARDFPPTYTWTWVSNDMKHRAKKNGNS